MVGLSSSLLKLVLNKGFVSSVYNDPSYHVLIVASGCFFRRIKAVTKSSVLPNCSLVDFCFVPNIECLRFVFHEEHSCVVHRTDHLSAEESLPIQIPAPCIPIFADSSFCVSRCMVESFCQDGSKTGAQLDFVISCSGGHTGGHIKIYNRAGDKWCNCRNRRRHRLL
jgi:hypothetical protein